MWEDVIDMKHFQARVAARNKTSWSLKASLNVTQAAAQKERWREKTHKKKFTKQLKQIVGIALNFK